MFIRTSDAGHAGRRYDRAAGELVADCEGFDPLDDMIWEKTSGQVVHQWILDARGRPFCEGVERTPQLNR